MAKRSSVVDTERLIFCSGPAWIGDGSKETSRCPSNDSRRLSCSRYQCHYCATKSDPAKTLADANGLTEYGGAYYEQDNEQRIQIKKAGIVSGESRKAGPKADDLPALMLAGLDEIKPDATPNSAATETPDEPKSSATPESKPRRPQMRTRKLPRSAQ